MSKKSKNGNLGSALEAAGVTAERYVIPYDAKKIATDVATRMADRLRGKVLFNHTAEFTEADYDAHRAMHWDQYYVASAVKGDYDIEAMTLGLLADIPAVVGNRFVAFANVPPVEQQGYTARVRHVSVRCQLDRDASGIHCLLDVFICVSGARDA